MIIRLIIIILNILQWKINLKQYLYQGYIYKLTKKKKKEWKKTWETFNFKSNTFYFPRGKRKRKTWSPFKKRDFQIQISSALFVARYYFANTGHRIIVVSPPRVSHRPHFLEAATPRERKRNARAIFPRADRQPSSVSKASRHRTTTFFRSSGAKRPLLPRLETTASRNHRVSHRDLICI